MPRYELRTVDEGGPTERFAVMDVNTGHYVKVADAAIVGRSYSSEYWVPNRALAQGVADALNEKQPSTMRIRKPGQYSRRIEQMILVAPQHAWHDRGLKLRMKVPDWQPGRYNASEQEYNQTEKANEGYLYFSASFWEDEPDQEVFDAVCRWMVDNHLTYLRWHQRKVDQYGEDWGIEPEPFELPKGTCRFNPDDNTWSLTPREPSFEIDLSI